MTDGDGQGVEAIADRPTNSGTLAADSASDVSDGDDRSVADETGPLSLAADGSEADTRPTDGISTAGAAAHSGDDVTAKLSADEAGNPVSAEQAEVEDDDWQDDGVGGHAAVVEEMFDSGGATAGHGAYDTSTDEETSNDDKATGPESEASEKGSASTEINDDDPSAAHELSTDEEASVGDEASPEGEALDSETDVEREDTEDWSDEDSAECELGC